MADDTSTDSVEDPGQFTLTLVDEANPTVDGRVFEPGVVTWREPPLPLMFLTENIGPGEGHKGSKVGASIQEIWRDGTKIKGRGTFGTGEEGQTMRRLISEGLLNGVSADVGGAVLEQELAEDGSTQSRIMQGQIMGATVLPFPAFDDTRISVVAAAVPQEPPLDWFANPRLEGPTPLTITRDGHVFGHAALWGTCHIGRPGSCLTPPHSTSNYSYFKTGSVLTADGSSVATGPITMSTGHAGLALNSKATVEHYDHTGTGIADVVAGEDSYGIWVAGAIRPGIQDDKLRTLRASALSGDWRSIGGRLELVALLAVNTPGFPIPRAQATFADESEALALVAAGVVDDELSSETDMSAETTEEFDWSPQAREAAAHARGAHAEGSGATASRGQGSSRGRGALAQKDDHNDPTAQDNRTDETPHNAKADSDSEPLHEQQAAENRKGAGAEYSDEEIEELTAKVEALERAVMAFGMNRLSSFEDTVSLRVLESEDFRDFTEEKRADLAKKGHAMPDGSFPMETVKDVDNAAQAWAGRGGKSPAVKKLILKRAKALGAMQMIQDKHPALVGDTDNDNDAGSDNDNDGD